MSIRTELEAAINVEILQIESLEREVIELSETFERLWNKLRDFVDETA